MKSQFTTSAPRDLPTLPPEEKSHQVEHGRQITCAGDRGRWIQRRAMDRLPDVVRARARAHSSASRLQLHLRPKSVDILRQHVMGDLEPANQWILYQGRERRLWRVF
jgi:hypothetical protein